VPEPLKPGDAVGDYRIESVLGRGGMGTVYLATQERLGRKVALKVISPELAEDREFHDRFLRESQVAASLDHPNVIPVHDAGEADGVLYIAMRYVSGPTLSAMLRERGSLPPEEALRIGEQIAGALDAAHAAGLVHRDVKPANVLLAEPGGHAYLCDFGLAKRTASVAVTSAGVFLGTADYSAPEQIDGRPLDGRADVYSLGCMLFHCLAGRPPYVRDTELAVLHSHLHDPPPSLASVRPDLPPALDSVIARATAKDPDDRYATAGALAGAMRGALGAAQAGETRAAPVAKPRRSRRRLLLTLLAVLAAAGGIAGGLIATRGGSSTPHSPPPLSLPAFVDRVETALEESSSARQAVGGAVSAGFACALMPPEAASRIGQATDARQRTLASLAAVHAPAAGTRSLALLRQALRRSVEADRHYRDGFLALPASVHCPLPGNAGFRLASAADARATTAKQQFVKAFDPLARRFGGRIWSAGEF